MSPRRFPSILVILLATAQGSVPLYAQAEPTHSRATSATLWSTLAAVVPIAAGVAVAGTGSGGTGQTVVFGALFWGGAIVGPATGYWYGHIGKRAVPGLILRSATFTLASALAPTQDYNDGILPNPDLDQLGAWLLATSVIVASATVDIVKVRRTVLARRKLKLSRSSRCWTHAMGGSVSSSMPLGRTTCRLTTA